MVQQMKRLERRLERTSSAWDYTSTLQPKAASSRGPSLRSPTGALSTSTAKGGLREAETEQQLFMGRVNM